MSGDDKKLISMGALVGETICTICGHGHTSADHKVAESTPSDEPNPLYEASKGEPTELPITPLMSRDNPHGDEFKVGQVRFLYATVVPAPPCNECGNAMAAASIREWACKTDGCGQQGAARVVAGVNPIIEKDDR